MHTDQLRQKDFIAALFSQDNQQQSPDPDFFNSQSFQNTQNLPGPLSPSNEQQNFAVQNNGNSNLLWEQQLKIQQLQQLHQLQQQIFQQQVRRRRPLQILSSLMKISQMEILNGTQRAVQPVQVPNPGQIDTQRSHPQHLHGLPTPGKVSLSRLPLPHHGLLFPLQPPLLSCALSRITNMCRR